jgi:hypothetical protein
MRKETLIDYREPNIDVYSDLDVEDSYESYESQEPENPYEDDDGGWDPSIG